MGKPQFFSGPCPLVQHPAVVLGAAGAGATFLAQLPVGNYQALSPNSGEMFTYPPSTCVNWWLGDGRGEVSAQGGGSVTSLPPPQKCVLVLFPEA